MKRVICVVGPTATGKTELAVRLAQALDGEVVSCDSMQVYRDMPIGTAQPTPEEQKGIPHHMLAVADPAEAFSVGKFVAQADPIVQDILARGKTAILAGGTGLYVDALAAGRSFAPTPRTGRREALEARADREGIEALLADLRRVDPQSAARLHPGNRRRIIRALEVFEATGIPFSKQAEHEAADDGLTWRVVSTAMERPALYDRINQRVTAMIRQGLKDEVERLLSEGVPPGAQSMSGLGYKEMIPCIRGEYSLEEAADRIRLGTRHYAKRQMTYLKKEAEITYVRTEAPDAYDQIRKALTEGDRKGI